MTFEKIHKERERLVREKKEYLEMLVPLRSDTILNQEISYVLEKLKRDKRKSVKNLVKLLCKVVEKIQEIDNLRIIVPDDFLGDSYD